MRLTSESGAALQGDISDLGKLGSKGLWWRMWMPWCSSASQTGVTYSKSVYLAIPDSNSLALVVHHYITTEQSLFQPLQAIFIHTSYMCTP